MSTDGNKIQHILSLLREAYADSLRGAGRSYRRRLVESKERIGQLPDTEKEKLSLQGEWLLVSAFGHLQTPDEFCGILRQAAALLEGNSRVVPHRAHLLLEFYTPFGTWHSRPGRADEEADLLEEATDLFYRMTGGGKGTELCYRAHMAYYRGEFDQAQVFAKQALETGRQQEQELICLCAAEVLAGVAKHTHEEDLWHTALSIIEEIRGEGKSCAGRLLAELACCNLDLSLGLLHSVPRWVQEGHFPVLPDGETFQSFDENFPSGVFPQAMIVRMLYQCYNGQPVEALKTAEMIDHVYHLKSVVLSAYVDFLRFGCYTYLGEEERAMDLLERGIRLIAPDRLWLIAAEFVETYGDMVYDVAAKVDPAAPDIIRHIGEGFCERLKPLREKSIEDAPAALSKREREVVDLLLQGKKNSEIAEMLHISARTVGAHLENIYRKHSVSRRSQLSEAMQKNAVKFAIWINEEQSKNKK